jgi:glyoxylase-like metal-dependent hydrolase (beta-lactamase superfamily II)
MRGEDISVEIVSQEPWIAMYTAPNPGPKTLTGTHTYVVGRNNAVLIDPGPRSLAYQNALASSLRAANVTVAAILLSHGHPDHAPGASILKGRLGVEVVASEHMAPDVAADSAVDRRFADGETFHTGSDAISVIPTPGHAPDQVAFWMPESRILFTGDTVLGSGSTLVAPPAGDMTAYMQTLEQLRALGPRLMLPGHGPVVTDPGAKIAEYIAHRLEREAQLVDVLSERPSTIPQLVARLYADTDPRLHDLARGSVAAQLEKLVREGKVERDGDVYGLCIA